MNTAPTLPALRHVCKLADLTRLSVVLLFSLNGTQWASG